MSSIIAFATARLDEEEEAAKRAAREGYPSGPDPLNGWFVTPGTNVARPITLSEGRYAALHDPARTLRDIEGKRAILARYEDCLARMEDPAYPHAAARDQAREYEDFVLPNLLARWDDHPDHDQGWKP